MGTTILIVEDNEDALDLWAMIFMLEGYNVATARDGEEGYRKARLERPSVILTDVNMPNVDGLEMIRRVRACPELRDLPVVAVTAHGRHIEGQALEAGADRVVDKPADVDHLATLIAELVES